MGLRDPCLGACEHVGPRLVRAEEGGGAARRCRVDRLRAWPVALAAAAKLPAVVVEGAHAHAIDAPVEDGSALAERGCEGACV
eukprot:6305239-Prymnesium_polylepis.1